MKKERKLLYKIIVIAAIAGIIWSGLLIALNFRPAAEADVSYDLYTAIRPHSESLGEAEKAKIANLAKEERLQEMINRFDEVSSSEVMIVEGERIDVVLTLSPDTKLATNTENNIINLVRRSTEFSEENIFLIFKK